MTLTVYKTELNDFDSNDYPCIFKNVKFVLANSKLFTFAFSDKDGIYTFNFDFPYYFFEVINE